MCTDTKVLLSLSLSDERNGRKRGHDTNLSLSLSQSAETSHKFLSFFEANAKRELFFVRPSSQKISIPFIYIITLRVYNIKMASTVRCFIVDAFWSLAFLFFYCARALKRFSSNGWGFVPSRGPLRELIGFFFFPLLFARTDQRERTRREA